MNISRYFCAEGELGNTIEIYMLDCVEGIRRYCPEDCIDVVVTSPPYNIGIKYNSHFDQLPFEQYLSWLEEISSALHSALKDDGSFFLNIGGKPTAPWVPFDVAQRLREQFILQNTIHWIKSIAIDKEAVGNYSAIRQNIAVGHYKPIGGKRFLHDCHEYIFHFTKTGKVPLDRLAIGVPYQDKSNIGRWKAAKQDKRCRGNTWFIPYKTIRDRDAQRPHPSTFPVELPERCLRLHGLRRAQRVLDPFMGLGSTALACVRLGLSCVGFEIDPLYFKTACERLTQALKQPNLVRCRQAR